MFRIDSIMNESQDIIKVHHKGDHSTNNYYTIVTGDNASGKSTLLSKAINFFLFDINDDNRDQPVNINPSSLKQPSKIIALCNSRFDRFTSTYFFNRSLNSKITSLSSMYYIHPELTQTTRRGIAGIVDKCLKNLLINQKTRSDFRVDRVNEAFTMFGLQSLIHIKIIINKRNLKYIIEVLNNLINGRMILSNEGIIYNHGESTSNIDWIERRDNKLNELLENIWKEIENNSIAHEICNLLSMIDNGNYSTEDLRNVYFSIAEGKILPRGRNYLFSFSRTEIINYAFILNVFNVSDFRIMHLNSNKEVSISSLSSGQRTLFGHATILSSFVEDNCMICIDEPENSLHPEWQLNFMRFISSLCSDTIGSHIFIATHSPQIISGMQFDNGCVLSLANKDFIDRIITSKGRKILSDRFYEPQPLKIYIEQSADKQLTDIFKSPGYKNDFIIRKLLLILSKSSKKIKLTEVDCEFISEIEALIEKDRIPDGDPVQFLLKQIVSFQKVRGSHDK